jgi:ankyrin repeat protein
MQKNKRLWLIFPCYFLMFPIKLLSQVTDFENFFIATSIDDSSRVRQLLQRKFDPNTPTPEGDSALMLSLRTGSMKVFQTLLELPEIHINQRNRVRETALMLAAFTGNLTAVQALLERQAEVNHTGWTALHYAATTGHVDILRLLLEHHAYVDARAPNQMTPLMLAARSGHVEAVKLLLDQGAVDSLKNDVGLTAEDFARSNRHHELAEAFKRRRQRSAMPAWYR